MLRSLALNRRPTSGKKRPANQFRNRVEALEDRRVPAVLLDLSAATAVLANLSFTDSGGNVVGMKLGGTSGNVSITSNESVLVNGLLDPGEEISAIAITNASANFSLTFTSTGSGDGTVSLGDITSDKAILGIFTVGSSTSTTDFQLGSFVGTTLSTKGAINVTSVLGNSSGVGLRFTQGLAAKTSVNVQNDLTGDVIIGTTASQNFAGTINVGGNILEDGDGSVVSVTGGVLSTGVIHVGGNVDSDLNVTGVFSGVLTVAGNVAGDANFATNVATTARLQASSWTDVNIQGNLSGQLTAHDGDIDLFVKKNIDGSAVVQSAGNITLDVDGNVLGKSSIDAEGDLTGSVAASLASRLTAGGDISLDINGAVGASTINAGGNLILDVATTVTTAKIRADGSIGLISKGIVSSNVTAAAGNITLSVVGPVTNSNFSGVEVGGSINGAVSSSVLNASDNISLSIVGSVTNSRFLSANGTVSASVTGNAATSTFQSLNSDVSVGITGSLTAGRINGGIVSLDVGGNTTTTRINASGDLAIDINGGLIDSTVNADGSISADIGTGVLRSTLTTDTNDINITLGAGIADSHLDAGGSLSVSAGGALLRAHLIAANSVTLDVVAGNVDASVVQSATADISANIGGAISKTNFIAANGNISLHAAKTVTDVDLHASAAIAADITGAATRVEFLTDDDITLNVGGSLTDSEVDSASGNVIASVGIDLLGTRVSADNALTLDVTRNLNAGGTSSKRLFATISADTIDLDVGGSVLAANINAQTSAVVGVNGSFNGSISTEDLDFTVGGNPSGPVFISGGVSAASVIQAERVLDIDGDDVGFFVGGNFDGLLDVATSFSTGTGAVATAINGQVGVNGKINIESIDEANSATELVFGSLFRGEFNLNEDLDVDLTFNGNVEQLNINGQISETIKVNGKINQLSTGSGFVAAGVDGNFTDANGVVTGNLDTTTGFGVILP